MVAPYDLPDENETLRPVVVDLKEHQGKEIFIRLIDRHTGPQVPALEQLIRLSFAVARAFRDDIERNGAAQRDLLAARLR